MNRQETYRIILKYSLWGGVLCLLFIPMWQQYYRYFEEEPLHGSYTETKPPVLNSSTWFTGEYQKEQQNYLNEQFGFRPYFVRLHNQMYYDLYNQARANDVIIGKKKYLYGRRYIDAYLGKDYIGEEATRNKIKS